MLTILPVEDQECEAAWLKEHLQGGNAHAEARVLEMKDGAETLAFAAVAAEGGTAYLLCVQGAEGPEKFIAPLSPDARFCVDSLMRAAASYGVNHGAYIMMTEQKELADYFLSVGFKPVLNDIFDGYEIPLSKIVTIC